MEVAGATTAGNVFTTPTTKRFDELKNEDFFALLIAELRAQDPLNPADNQQLFSQMSQIRQIEQSTTLNATLQALAAEQRFGATSGLIGHYVSGSLTSESGDQFEVQGLVIGVRFESDGRAILELHDGNSIPAEEVDQVTLLENLPPEILEQLQSELPPEEAAAGDTGAARARASDPARVSQSGGGDVLRSIAQGVDTTASILSSFFSPGIKVGM
ncbi:MAG: hypothetical protein O7D94_00235 [Planctomycetota bacterium]|nr:hypothetical protein [Planctomycetota bacterium]